MIDILGLIQTLVVYSFLAVDVWKTLNLIPHHKLNMNNCIMLLFYLQSGIQYQNKTAATCQVLTVTSD